MSHIACGLSHAPVNIPHIACGLSHAPVNIPHITCGLSHAPQHFSALRACLLYLTLYHCVFFAFVDTLYRNNLLSFFSEFLRLRNLADYIVSEPVHCENFLRLHRLIALVPDVSFLVAQDTGEDMEVFRTDVFFQ